MRRIASLTLLFLLSGCAALQNTQPPDEVVREFYMNRAAGGADNDFYSEKVIACKQATPQDTCGIAGLGLFQNAPPVEDVQITVLSSDETSADVQVLSFEGTIFMHLYSLVREESGWSIDAIEEIPI